MHIDRHILTHIKNILQTDASKNQHKGFGWSQNEIDRDASLSKDIKGKSKVRAPNALNGQKTPNYSVFEALKKYETQMRYKWYKPLNRG